MDDIDKTFEKLKRKSYDDVYHEIFIDPKAKSKQEALNMLAKAGWRAEDFAAEGQRRSEIAVKTFEKEELQIQLKMDDLNGKQDE